MSDAASPLSVSMLVGLNVIGSVLLVAVNKLLVVSYGFRHMVLLSGLHFAVGWAVLQAASAPALPAGSRLFERKAPGWLAALPAAVAGALSIVLMNYSLRTNSLGSYQMLKVAVLPATIALAAGQGTAVTGADVGAAALVSLGTAVATVTDVDLSLAGTAVGLAAVAATAQYQVAQGRVQTELVLSSAQALHALSAPQAVLTLVAAVVFETAWQARLGGGGTSLRGGSVPALGSVAPDDIWSHAYSANEVGLIVLTCICAAILNYSGIAIIGKINPVAFQFVNQLKTVLIVAVGFILFAESAEFSRLASLAAGLIFVITGVAWYSRSRAERDAAKAAAASAAKAAALESPTAASAYDSLSPVVVPSVSTSTEATTTTTTGKSAE